MPLVRIDLQAGTTPQQRAAIGAIVYRAMREELGVPPDDRFQIVSEHAPDNFLHTASYLGVRYSERLLIVQITLNQGRTVDQKKAFYRRVANDLVRDAGFDAQDVFINLVEVARENWSFGNGVAQYAQ
jgi:4-oxalocrotonate tautomerase